MKQPRVIKTVLVSSLLFFTSRTAFAIAPHINDSWVSGASIKAYLGIMFIATGGGMFIHNLVKMNCEQKKEQRND